MKLRQPSAGNERIRLDEVRRGCTAITETVSLVDDEGARALAVAREWEGYASAAATEPGRGADVSDPTGGAVVRPEWTATIYEELVHDLHQWFALGELVKQKLGRIRESTLDATQQAALERMNSNAGQCDACGRHHDPTRGDRDDRLKDAGDGAMYGPDCYTAWQRNLMTDSPAVRRVFQRMRAQRLTRETA